MQSGQQYAVMVTMRNSGSTGWTPEVVRLRSEKPEGNTIWGTAEEPLNVNVAPGDTFVFTFNVTAPSTSGDYDFQWRLVEDLGADGKYGFGEGSTSILVTVQ